jgi:predicted Ser/Thr protein kinase
MSPEKHAKWIQGRLDKEAAMLEIKASQETAWKAYAAASIEVVTAFTDRKPLSHDADAATITRQHADKAAAMAQNLAKLADATEKLQSVLSEDQRKVLDRIVRRLAQTHGMHHHQMHGPWQGHEGRQHGPGMAPDAANSAPKAPAPGKSKN